MIIESEHKNIRKVRAPNPIQMSNYLYPSRMILEYALKLQKWVNRTVEWIKQNDESKQVKR